MKVNIKKTHKDAVIPKYAKIGDAGLDLSCISKEFNIDTYQYIYDTGISLEIPDGYCGLLLPRSSICKYSLNLSNSVGLIDSKFRGNIKFIFNLINKDNYTVYNVGDRIGQILILPYPNIEFNEVEELSITERGNGGFGSSGK